MIHCIIWAKALYEGLYGNKDQASSNIIEDIIEELDQARGSSATIQFAEILFQRLFSKEVLHLV